MLATTYYVSSATGNDADNGLSPATAFASVARVNALALAPGDEVRFACGETWRADPLVLTRSGASGAPITITSNPPDCAAKPLLSGAQPIAGWTLHQGSTWVADLAAGANAGRFPHGVNQLFSGAERLPFGRWPDVAGHAAGGWAAVDSQPSSTTITDAELPAGDWSGAVAHLRGMTWYILNRAVVADAGNTLTLGVALDCWGGNCAGWGYFLSNHLATLSREGEWYYDAATSRVYLVAAAGPPADGAVEGAVVLADDGRYHGGVVLGRDLQEHLSWVTVANLRVERWFDAGVTTPLNQELADSSRLILRNLDIRDVDSTGLRLATWVWNAGAQSGWRGGHDLALDNVLIERANHFGVDSYAHSSTLTGLTVRDVGLLANLGASGLGCGLDGSGGFCTEAGAGVRLKRHLAAHSSHHLTFTDLTVERTGMNGVDLFGDTITIAGASISDSCQTKSDCGAVRSYGDGNLVGGAVHDILISDTVIRDALADNHGCHPSYRYPLAFGLYFDHGSAAVDAERVTVTGCRAGGILYQDATGEVRASTVYDIRPGTWGGSGIIVAGSSLVTVVDSAVVSEDATVGLVDVDNAGQLTGSDRNWLFQPRTGSGLCVGGSCTSLAGWRAATGQDAASTAAWYALAADAPPRATLFTNPTPAAAPAPLQSVAWSDLDQQPVASLTLDPWAGVVLVADEDLLFADGFEAGTTAAW